MKLKTLRDVKQPLGSSVTSHLGGRRPQPPRPISAAHVKAANRWASAYLPGQDPGDMQRGLAVLLTHPEQASPGYSKAKTARQRLQLELNRRRAFPQA